MTGWVWKLQHVVAALCGIENAACLALNKQSSTSQPFQLLPTNILKFQN